MGSMAASNESAAEEAQSIWIQKTEGDLRYTNAKKLEKAKQALAKKADRREANPVVNVNRYKNSEATATQIISAKAGSGVSSTTRDIKIEGFDVSFGEQVLLKHTDLSLTFGRRYGFVGRNGLGKSTLLHMISSRQLLIPAHMSILHVEQEVIGDETIALQSVLESDTVREGLFAEETAITKAMADG
jgi:ATP-binding cassette subfamily F protein 3